MKHRQHGLKLPETALKWMVEAENGPKTAKKSLEMPVEIISKQP
jgi:hypothetical protein